MAIISRYKRYYAKQPIISLSGQFYRPYPLLDVTLIGPGGVTIYRRGLLDNGSDDTVFSEHDAQQLGIDLTKAPTGGASGVGLITASLRYAEITFRIAGPGERRE